MSDLLIIDDDRALCELLADYLGRHGYRVSAVHNGADGLRRIAHKAPDLVILDVMMPGMDGFEVMRAIRRDHGVPVLMFSGRDDDVDRVLGLELGSDDYVVKPSTPREILARIRAILRRSGSRSGNSGHTVTLGSLRIDGGQRRARGHGELLPLTAAEFDLLEQLVRRRGGVVDRDYLSEQVLGRRLLPDDRSLDVHVSRLRSKLQAAGCTDITIEAVRGRGYFLTLEGET